MIPAGASMELSTLRWPWGPMNETRQTDWCAFLIKSSRAAILWGGGGWSRCVNCLDTVSPTGIWAGSVWLGAGFYIPHLSSGGQWWIFRFPYYTLAHLSLQSWLQLDNVLLGTRHLDGSYEYSARARGTWGGGGADWLTHGHTPTHTTTHPHTHTTKHTHTHTVPEACSKHSLCNILKRHCLKNMKYIISMIINDNK